LRLYVARAAARAVGLALATGGLVFIALDRQLVRPMRVMTAGIAGFRRNPGYAGLGGLKWLSGRGDGEIARAARELVAMQDELRAALWRNARLAALGTAVAKISHDLRNILTAALMVADRFHQHRDPAVERAATTLIQAIERAVELVSRTMDFVQEGPPAIVRSPVALATLVREAADMLGANAGSIAIDNRVPAGLHLALDRNQIYRVLVNLLRNAIEAGATRITLNLEGENGTIHVLIADNGPGLPQNVVANLFRPFTGAGRNGGTGLGLAIARDLIRAHGDDLLLRRTGPEGTEFAIGLSSGLPARGSVGQAGNNQDVLTRGDTLQ
jgi:signal transduction histidine kinase